MAKFIAVLGGGGGPAGGSGGVLTILDPARVHHGSVSFVPPPLPIFATSIAAVQTPALTAAGRAFFIDSSGSVSSLAPDGSPVKVASFPFRAGEEISFAVSPDASQIMAIVVTMSNEHATGYSVYLATAGGAATIVRGPVASSSIPRLLTWIADGPVVVTDASLGFQGCEVGACRPWGHAVLMDPASGGFGAAALGGSDCAIWDVSDAAVLCSSGPIAFSGDTPANLSVRSLDGSSSRSVAITTRCGGCYSDARLSPNGDVALDEIRPADLNSQSSVVIDQAGTTRVVAGQGDFAPYMWFDAQTVIGVTSCASVGCTLSGGSLAALSTSASPLPWVSLGLSGTPVGVLFK